MTCAVGQVIADHADRHPMIGMHRVHVVFFVFEWWNELTSMYITLSSWKLTRLKPGVTGCLAQFSRWIVHLNTFDCQRMMLHLFKVVCVTLSESPITVLRFAQAIILLISFP